MSKISIRYPNGKIVSVTAQVAKVLVKAKRAEYVKREFPTSVNAQEIKGKIEKPLTPEVKKTVEENSVDSEKTESKGKTEWPSTVSKTAETVPLKKSANSKKANSKSEKDDD